MNVTHEMILACLVLKDMKIAQLEQQVAELRLRVQTEAMKQAKQMNEDASKEVAKVPESII